MKLDKSLLSYTLVLYLSQLLLAWHLASAVTPAFLFWQGVMLDLMLVVALMFYVFKE